VSHVEFGTRWFRIFCQEQGLNADEEFERQFKKMALLSPRKERLSENLRRRAGFNESEMRFLKSI
jgi:uncharacterized ferritin-like protein (DUF455 family)